MAAIQEILQEMEILEPVQAGSLSVLGLRWQGKDGLAYLTLDEALETDQFQVTEINESGSVPILQVKNRLEEKVFLMAGEELIGAKQNRVLNASLMIGAGSETKIPVSCVEQGRWGYRSRQFRSGGSRSPSNIRRAMSVSSFHALRREGVARSDQGEVWDMVDSTMHLMGSVSDSFALHQVYEDHEASLSDYLSKLKCPEGCCGAAFVVGARLAGIDFFDKPETLTKLWPKLVRSYAVDALIADRRGKANDAKAGSASFKEFLHRASQAQQERFESPGLGQDIRLSGQNVVAASLVVEDQPVHTEMFEESDQGRR